MASRSLRPHIPLPALALTTLLGTVLLAALLDVPIRDPDEVIGSRFWLVPALLALFWALDVIPRALRGAGMRPRAWPGACAALARERWSARRVGLVLLAFVSFYVVYLAYRNAKSFLPLVRDSNFDEPLRELDQALLFGFDSATLLHDLLGTGLAAHVLSVVYLAFLTFIPLSLAVALIWTRKTGPGLWYVTAISINWILGIASYYLLPALGPIYAYPALFSELPDTGVAQLQQALADDRLLFLFQSFSSDQASSIAAFASLHVSIVFTAALMATILALARPLQYTLWIFFALTIVATLYFGWHYIVDDIAGIAIGAAAVYLAALATGSRGAIDDWRRRRALARADRSGAVATG